MTRGSIWLVITTVGIITWGLSAPSPVQAESSEILHCPAGYSQVGSECINSDGDVIKP